MQNSSHKLSFSRKYRLVSKQDFQSVFAKPHKIKHKYLLALYQSNQKTHARLGIIINKHHVKLAVTRNKLRRVIRESFRVSKEALKGLDIIILMRSECSALCNDKVGMKTLSTDIDKLWQLIKIKPT